MNAALTLRGPHSSTWEQPFRRFAAFQAMPSVVGSGPQMKRPSETATFNQLRRRFLRDREFLPDNPGDLTQAHIDRLVGSSRARVSKVRSRPSSPSLWKGLWRAIILDRDDYTCHFCNRSAERGVVIEGEGRLALRLELDHIVPRSAGGNDYVLTNIRTLCRTCNLTRGRMKEAYLVAEMKSLAAALSA